MECQSNMHKNPLKIGQGKILESVSSIILHITEPPLLKNSLITGGIMGNT